MAGDELGSKGRPVARARGRIAECSEELALLDVADSGIRCRYAIRHRKATEEIDTSPGSVARVKGDTLPWTPNQVAHTWREPYGVVDGSRPSTTRSCSPLASVRHHCMLGEHRSVKPCEHERLRLAFRRAAVVPHTCQRRT